jgi:oligopeptide/dipeptide ABC transporter ATP-binding protein
MYAGRIVEEAKVDALFATPLHPYTRGLLTCIPRPGITGKLPVIEGMVPHPGQLPEGCNFHTRCPYVQERCRKAKPPLIDIGGRKVACFIVGENAAEVRE